MKRGLKTRGSITLIVFLVFNILMVILLGVLRIAIHGNELQEARIRFQQHRVLAQGLFRYAISVYRANKGLLEQVPKDLRRPIMFIVHLPEKSMEGAITLDMVPEAPHITVQLSHNKQILYSLAGIMRPEGIEFL